MKKIYLLICYVLFLSLTGLAQNSIEFRVTSLKPGDSCTVTVQKSSEILLYKKLIGGTDSTASYTFQNLSNGKWAIKLDATGYYFPSTQTIDLNNSNKLVVAKLTKITLANNVEYLYQWEDDSSYVGHAQQTYINGDKDLVILNETIKIPDDFSSVNLLYTHGIALSDKITPWAPEDAYRLLQMINKIPALANLLNNEAKKEVTSVWAITNDEVIDDINVVSIGNIKKVTVSRKAFVYAIPLIVDLDGIKGRFYSKRLYNAVLNFATDFGRDQNSVATIAMTRFGVRFLEPDMELQNLMKEDRSNFQSFSAFEKMTILSMFEELPDGMHLQTNLKYLVRRIAGQLNPKYPAAAAVAWTGLNTIEFMSSAFETTVYSAIQRLVLHEKTHFLWAGLFEQKLKDDWSELGGWYLDPTAGSGWSTTRTTEFVSAYAHGANPDEDMAESVAYYVTNPDMLMSRSIRKFEFIRDRIMHGTRYIAQIRKDLTFMVYNLYPDYNYPGKIESVKVQVLGKPDQDKTLVIELRLHAIDSLKDGAIGAYTRISSSIGTIFDIGMYPVNGNQFYLRGERPIPKEAKSGYWTVNQIMTRDAVGNDRYENNNTFGLKIFINNSLEDITPPKYIDNTLNLSLGTGKFKEMAPQEVVDGDTYQYIQSKFDISEKNNLDYIGLWFAIPKNDENGVKQAFQFGVMGNDHNYIKNDSIKVDLKHIIYRYPIPEYFPTGNYVVTNMRISDIAQNVEFGYFMKDTTLFKANPPLVTKHIRDSIYIKTQYPDFIPPVLDVNQISISATPTHPSNPDGETHFVIEIFARDSSAYVGHEAGLFNGNYILRDPQGKQFNFPIEVKSNGLLKDPSGNPGSWQKYTGTTLLPRGSAPGIWGVESITLEDKARNRKFYSFVELVRFDVEEKDSAQKVFPRVQILNKKVNAQNVDSISMSIACKDGINKLYRARIYSDMGGNSVVYEGKMSSDSVVIKNIKLSGVNDGIIFATVFITDTSKVLLGIGKASYTKDVLPPHSSLFKTNLSNFGKSNIDSLIVQLQTTEKNGSYVLTMEQQTVSPNKAQNASASGPQVVNGTFTGGNIQIPNSMLKSFEDGIIKLTFILKDSVDNKAEPIVKLLYKDTKDPVITLKNEISTGLKYTYSITSDEFISNIISSSEVKVSNGTVSSIVKLTDKNFKIVIDRSCNDTLTIRLDAKVLKDTVGNGNSAMNQSFIDKIIPSKPVISLTGSQFTTTSTAANYQWLLNNIIIPGAISTNYLPTISGSYQLKISSSTGCTNTSDAISYIITGIINLQTSSDHLVNVFPNPVTNQISVVFDFIPQGTINIQLINIEGQLLKTFSTNDKSTQISLSQFNNGIYYLKMIGKNYYNLHKLIIAR